MKQKLIRVVLVTTLFFSIFICDVNAAINNDIDLLYDSFQKIKD